MDIWTDNFKEECGIFGIFGHPEASTLTQLGLFAVQHRGQEACGIVAANDDELQQFRGVGLIADVLNPQVLATLPGEAAIGHTRYSTTGKSTIKEVQPFCVTCQHGQIAVCHNGNLPFAEARDEDDRNKAVAGFHSAAVTETTTHFEVGVPLRFAMLPRGISGFASGK